MSFGLQVICQGAIDLLAPNGFLALEVCLDEYPMPFSKQSMIERTITSEHTAGLFLPLQTDGMQQAQHVATLLRQLTAKDGRTFSDISIIDDCFGVSRFVTAWLS